ERGLQVRHEHRHGARGPVARDDRAAVPPERGVGPAVEEHVVAVRELDAVGARQRDLLGDPRDQLGVVHLAVAVLVDLAERDAVATAARQVAQHTPPEVGGHHVAVEDGAVEHHPAVLADARGHRARQRLHEPERRPGRRLRPERGHLLGPVDLAVVEPERHERRQLLGPAVAQQHPRLLVTVVERLADQPHGSTMPPPPAATPPAARGSGTGASRTLTPMEDEVDRIVAAWRRERPDLDPEPLHVFSRISRLARHLELARRAAFASRGLEPWAFDVLSALRRAGAPYELTPGVLMSQTLVSSGTMTNRIDRLVARRPARRPANAHGAVRPLLSRVRPALRLSRRRRARARAAGPPAPARSRPAPPRPPLPR